MNLRPYLARIRAEFPALTFKRMTVPEQGMDHLTLFLDDQWVFRFPTNPDYITRFPNEVALLDALHQRITLSIPYYELLARNREFGGYKKIDGTPVTPARFKRLSMPARKALAMDLARFLSELHSFPVKTAEKLGVERENPRGYHDRIVREYQEFVYPTLSAPDRKYAEAILQQSEDYCAEECPRVMAHNDMHSAHILLKNSRLAGIIDFGDKAINDPARDFCGLLDIDPWLLHAVYDKYAHKDRTLISRVLIVRKRGGLSWLAYNAKSKDHEKYMRAYRQFQWLTTLTIDSVSRMTKKA